MNEQSIYKQFNEHNPYKRVFAYLYLLRSEYELLIQYDKAVIRQHKSKGLIPKDGNKKEHLKHDCEKHLEGEVKFHTVLNGEINRLHASLKHKFAPIISSEMTSERILDLGELMDVLLEIKNVGEVGQILKEGLIDGEKRKQELLQKEIK